MGERGGEGEGERGERGREGERERERERERETRAYLRPDILYSQQFNTQMAVL